MSPTGAVVSGASDDADHCDVDFEEDSEDVEHALTTRASEQTAPRTREGFMRYRRAEYTREFETINAPSKFVTAWNFAFSALPLATKNTDFFPNATNFPLR